MRRLSKFTREQVKALAANPYTSKVDFRHIWYTEEFMTLFLNRYKNGDTSFEIFTSCGYDIEILGANRVYGFPRRVTRLLGINQELTISQGLTEPDGGAGVNELLDTDDNTVPIQQTISDMQRELEYLRRQIQLLKKSAGAADLESLSASDAVHTG